MKRQKVKKQEGTRFDRIISRIKNNPILSLVLLLGTIVIVLATFTDASMKLLSLIGKRHTVVDVSGRWTSGIITDLDTNDAVKLSFEFQRQGDMLLGVVRETWTSGYHGTYRILDGIINKNSISFRTEHGLCRWLTKHDALGGHVEREKVDSYNKLYYGTVSSDEIKFTIQGTGSSPFSEIIEFVVGRE
jgi:hypothetical protein